MQIVLRLLKVVDLARDCLHSTADMADLLEEEDEGLVAEPKEYSLEKVSGHRHKAQMHRSPRCCWI
jgi:hypothetical protein